MTSLGGVAFASLLLLCATGVHAQTDEERARKIVGGSCFLCHGQQGESTSEIFPRLAGQHAEYIVKQLTAFQTGLRKSTAMSQMVTKLTPEDMQALGKYYEQFSPPKEDIKDPQLATVGQYIFHNGNKFSGVPACISCHGPEARGAANLPRLAGQFSGYIQTQLKLFNKRERTNDNAVMHTVVEKMTELEMAAVAEYVSSK